MPSTLLWKISGNGLQKPSYLYGTMHLTNEKIFNLGDSLYKAIEKSDGLAIEVDPQVFTSFIIYEAKKAEDNDRKRLKDVMPLDKFEKYGKRLAKKLNKDAGDITLADIEREKNRSIQQSLRSGKMKTFLDIYLYDIARREGKWTGGVEDESDQEGIDNVSESDIEYFATSGTQEKMDAQIDDMTNYMIQAYIANDLNKIDSISNLEDSSYNERMLFNRNIKMARRMDSLGRIRSMVFAVGAAHLPGEKGLISLLKERGFTVTPVFSSRKIKPADYKVAEVPVKWYAVKDTESLYSVSMPGKPGEMTMYGLFHLKIYFDVFSSTVYMTAAIKTPYNQQMADSVFNSVLPNFYIESDYSKGTPITVNNVSGREFISKKDIYTDGYFLFNNGTMYMTIAMCMQKTSPDLKSINKFLHSLTIQPNTSDDQKEIVFTNKQEGFRVLLPAPARSADSLIGNNDTTTLKKIDFAIDPQSGAYFFFGSSEAAPGYNYPNDSSILVSFRQSESQKFKSLDVDSLYQKNGNRILDLKGMMKNVPLMFKIHYQMRGNRLYILGVLFDTSRDQSSVNRFFDSFDTLAYAKTKWNHYHDSANVFSTWAPARFIYKQGETQQFLEPLDKYISYDSARGDDFEVSIQDFGKYYWQKNDSSLWTRLIKNYTVKDSLVNKKEVWNGQVKGYEILLKRRGSFNSKRVRLLLNGNMLVTVTTAQSDKEINNENNNRFFDSFRINKPQPISNLFASKAGLILNDFASTDSMTSVKASYFLRNSSFTKADLSLLHMALLKKYPEKKYTIYQNPKQEIEDAIIKVGDSSSYEFAQNNFVEADDSTRNILLAIMASFPTTKHYNDIKCLLLKYPPVLQPGYDFINQVSDSLQLTAAIFPDLLPLLKDTAMAPVIINLSNKLLDSGFISMQSLLPYENLISDISSKQFTRYKEQEDDYNFSYQIEELLGKLNTSKTNSALNRWSHMPETYLRWNAIKLLLDNQQPLQQDVLDSAAKDLYTRADLYDSLRVYNRYDLFPEAYLSQEKIGESLAYISVSDDDPTDITYLADTVVNFKGRPSRFYFYKVAFNYDDDTTYSLACAGPFDIANKNVKLKESFGDFYYDEDFDSSIKGEQMKALLEQMEEGFKWFDQKDEKIDK
ncbi:MAG: TraB/GumN family protein [Ginsengibacter sp.]